MPVEPRANESSAPLATVSAPQGPFAPRDDCAADPAAAAFQTRLREVVAARDVAGLLAITDPAVELDFGGGSGHAELRQRLAAKDHDLWAELDRIMPLGCAIDQWGNVVLPWYFAQDTGGDPFETMLVTGENVPLLDAPAANAPVLARLSWEAVQLWISPDVQDPPGFTRVSWAKAQDGDALIGFMETAKLRSVIDYRLVADKTGGDYRLSAFIAGD